MGNEELIAEIKKTVLQVQPEAELFLYGSYARGDQHNDSDIDILILLNQDEINKKIRDELYSLLYNLELSANKVISPLIKAKKVWYEKYPNTGLFINISQEGFRL